MSVTAPSAGRPGWVRRHRVGGAAVVLGLVAVAVAALGTRAESGAPLDPDNPARGGAQALARVLDRDGVQVTVARTADQLAAARVDADTTVVVVGPDHLGRSTVRRLAADTTDAADVVVVGAGPGVLTALGVRASVTEVSMDSPRPADCADPRFAGLSLEVDRSAAYRGGDCFAGPAGRGSALVDQPADGSVLDPPLVLFGAARALTNDQVLRADNAAVALRLLGQHPHLVWYLPTLDDLTGDDGVSLTTLLPRWVRPGLWMGALALVALVLWRARRLGPLATEPVPVVVRAVETTRGLGRLYRRSGDRRHAAETLRRAARDRLAERLRLGRSAPAEAVLREVARRTGRRTDDVARLLGPDGDVPSNDRDLLTLADDLARLDDEVPRT